MKVSIVSVSRSAGRPQSGHVVCLPGWVEFERALACRPPLDIIGQLDRQLLLRHRDDAALLAVDDRDRRAPVALA